MPLSKVERQVLELICDEHRQTRRGAKEKIVLIGMNAVNHQQKTRVVDVLHALSKRGMLASKHNSWLPTKKAQQEIASDPADFDPIHSDDFVEPVSALAGALPEFSGTVEHIGAPLPDDLLNRCAAMNATLLAQAEKAHANGEPEAWRDLHWLMETGKQLVAAGGEA